MLKVELNFKKWLESFSQETESPIQNPIGANVGAFPTYEVPDSINPCLYKTKKKKRFKNN